MSYFTKMFSAVFGIVPLTYAITLIVPVQYGTIQQALDSAKQGDSVVVQPGTYIGKLLWPAVNGITLLSTEGAEKTVLDPGGDSGSLCGVHTGVDITTCIRGFTFQNASAEGT